MPSLVALDCSMAGFARDLEILDNTNNRTMDTAHVFYVKAGQTSAPDILSNVVRYMKQYLLIHIILCFNIDFIPQSDIFLLLLNDTQFTNKTLTCFQIYNSEMYLNNNYRL